MQGQRAWYRAQKGPRVIEGAKDREKKLPLLQLLKLSLVIKVNIITLLSKKTARRFNDLTSVCVVRKFGLL